jgi:hypothetical protein
MSFAADRSLPRASFSRLGYGVQTIAHSARTFSRPPTRNRRKPRSCLIVSGMRLHVELGHASRRKRIGIQYWRMASTTAGMSAYALRRNAVLFGPFLAGPSSGRP